MAKSTLTLAQKIFAISKRAGQIPRNGQDPETGKMYARLEDVLDVVSPLMLRYKVQLFPLDGQAQDSSNGTRGVTILWQVTDGIESRSFWLPGSGLDNEGHGTAIAITQSRKSALILLFNLRVADEPLISTDDAQTQADKIAASKIAAAQKRKDTIAAKEFVTVTWPESHNGHKALFCGRISVMEHGAFEYMQKVGKWNDREQGWYVPSAEVEDAIEKLKKFGCDVIHTMR
jgi:hypothetical protein